MKAIPTTYTAHWTLFLALLIGFVMATDVQAQRSREGRGRTSSERTTRVDKKKANKSRTTGRNDRQRAKQDKKTSKTRTTVTRSTSRTNGRSDRERARKEKKAPKTRNTAARTTSRTTTSRSRTRSTQSNDRGDRNRVEQRTRRVKDQGGRTGKVYVPPKERNRSKGNAKHKQYRDRYDYGNKHRKWRPYKKPNWVKRRRYYRRPHVYVRPGLHIHFDWPWVKRYNRHWAPRYRYRQVVYVNVGWGNRQRRAKVDMQTYYRHEVRHATPDYAEIDIYIDKVDLYSDGHYLGTVDRIPNNLSRVRATLYADGRVNFDRSVFVVGDPQSGFEMISTRYYDGYVLDDYRTSHGYKAGVLDLGRGRVEQVRYSRFFNPNTFDGYVPLSLLPDQGHWLWDYGEASMQAVHDADTYEYRTERGADIYLERNLQLERLED